MNLLYISPEFPPNFGNFIMRLAQAGVKVWGIGQADFFSMPKNIRQCMQWYVQTNPNNFEAVVDAIEKMKYHRSSLAQEGLSIVESHNEHWLHLESNLNELYNLKGIKTDMIDFWKKKSAMKALFQRYGFKVARGELLHSYEQALNLASQYGYPLILKPDEGVGANATYKINNEQELREILPTLNEFYFLEEFVEGNLVSYDGLTDYSGRIVFENSLVYSEGVLEYIGGNTPSFYVTKDIDNELRQLGYEIVKIFQIKRKFFHIEFFKVGNSYIPLEVNVRPPGGPIIDMMNYSVDDDLYRAYASVITHRPPNIHPNKKYYCGYVGRRDAYYKHSHEEISSRYPLNMVEIKENPLLFHEAMGKYKYIFRSRSKDKLLEIMRFILEQ